MYNFVSVSLFCPPRKKRVPRLNFQADVLGDSISVTRSVFVLFYFSQIFSSFFRHMNNGDSDKKRRKKWITDITKKATIY